MMSFANTLASINPPMMLERANQQMTSAIRHLSTGLAVERAADGPSALIAGEKFKGDIDRLYAQGDAEQRSYYVAAYTESVRGVAGDLLLALKSNVHTLANRSGLSDDERDALQANNDSILDAIDRLGRSAALNGDLVFKTNEDGSSELSADHLATIRDEQSGETYTLADLRSGGALAGGNFELADKLIGKAGSDNNMARVELGAQMREIEAMGNVRGIEIENMQDVLSRMIDADYAKEITRYVRGQTLQQGALAAQAIATRQNRAVLELMK